MIGILTAGGDCPGLNAVIRAVVRRATQAGHQCLGIRDGWRGLMEDVTQPLDRDDVAGIMQQGGTILGTSRMDPYVHGDGIASVRHTLERHGIDRVIVIGGEGSLHTGMKLWREGLPVIGVPKTIDNDIFATDVTFGFHTAVQIATDAIDRLTTTAESHNRVILVEVMGRNAGWLATYAGIAGGADAILVPEVPYDLEDLAKLIQDRHARQRQYSIVVVAEGIAPPPGSSSPRMGKDSFGFERLGGVSYALAPLIEEMTGFETRVTILGHIQRGGSPTAYDRVLATRLGVAATDLAMAGEAGVMVALKGDRIIPVPLEEACAQVRYLDTDVFDVARTFFG
ncbi:MAG: 6-phosphofructokinase [Acidimicrobiia bacterium]|nr:6-phosphofructokinase [Acidimicrobiia bacterium]